LYCLDFVARLPGVIGPPQRHGSAVRHGRRWSGHALAGLGLVGALVWAASGCRAAVTQPNTPKSPGDGAPLVMIDPSQDTTVDSIGTLDIVIAVHDAAYIDTVAVTFQGASQAYLPFYSGDTLFQAIIPVTLGPLKHQTFSFAVSAANILGRDTTTSTVNVRVR
jgi:hypothetical protein